MKKLTRGVTREIVKASQKIKELSEVKGVITIDSGFLSKTPKVMMLAEAFKETFPQYEVNTQWGKDKYELYQAIDGVHFFTLVDREEPDLRPVIEKFSTDMETLIAKSAKELEALNESS